MLCVNVVERSQQLGKFVHKFFTNGNKVGLVAADTFRAAAVDQLKIWSERTKSEFFSAKENSDPAALDMNLSNRLLKKE